ncbi:hypothetical protein F5141DRAFT_1059263 [Pisolithus sp. B1]|nr:hypothetical protein F5141DRAFT_1059263 [Pisolithus sp. B1]
MAMIAMMVIATASLYDNAFIAVDDQSGVNVGTLPCHPMESLSLSPYLTDYVHDLMGNITRWRAMLQANDVTGKTDVVKPFLKTFRQVPKCKLESNATVPPQKKRVMNYVTHKIDVKPPLKMFRWVPEHKPESDATVPQKKRVMNDVTRKTDVVKPFLKMFRWVPKHKPESNAAVPPPKKRVMKFSSISYVGGHQYPETNFSHIIQDVPQECYLWWLPDELLFNIVDLLDTDSL